MLFTNIGKSCDNILVKYYNLVISGGVRLWFKGLFLTSLVQVVILIGRWRAFPVPDVAIKKF